MAKVVGIDLGTTNSVIAVMIGGEPTVTVDRYPFATGQTYRDITYVSGPNGFVFPHYSPFFKSDDIGQTFRIPAHVPSFGQTFGTGGGGGTQGQVNGGCGGGFYPSSTAPPCTQPVVPGAGGCGGNSGSGSGTSGSSGSPTTSTTRPPPTSTTRATTPG